VCGSRPHRERPKRPELHRRRWQDLRAYVLRRDGHACVSCGERVGLVVHHVVPARDGGLDIPTNLATLCRRCHGAAHTKRRERRAGGSQK